MDGAADQCVDAGRARHGQGRRIGDRQRSERRTGGIAQLVAGTLEVALPVHERVLAARVDAEGMTVEDGQVMGLLPLPLAGLMSEGTPEEVDAGLRAVRAAAKSLGCPLSSPFMTLSFISLPTVPEAGISDLGLIDVKTHALIPVVVAQE